MTDPVISIRHLSKRYRLGLRDEAPDTFVQAALGWIKSPFANYQKLRRLRHFDDDNTGDHGESKDIIYALRDVTFDIKRGEVVGLIGRNGAGKSTLLKILSRVTEPTRGRVDIYGRVASLLEVGTGFHPELTGRENTYLNGTLLGMRKREIDLRLEEIVAFSEIDKFLDTPVKRYSSGMAVRLAFAVAAHLEPEILVVDEVLAVGDVEFQKKCLGKLRTIGEEGRTILFVSHNMEAIRSLCTRAILMRSGALASSGEPRQIVAQYLNRKALAAASTCFQLRGNSALEFLSLRVLNECNEPQLAFNACQSFTVEARYQVRQRVDNVELAIRIHNSQEIPVTTLISTDGLPERAPLTLTPGVYQARVTVPAHFLMPDEYSLSAAAFCFNRQVFDHREHALRFAILEEGTSIAKYRDFKAIGVVLNHFQWENSPLTLTSAP